MKTDSLFNRAFYRVLPVKNRAHIAANTVNNRLIYLSVMDKNKQVWEAFKKREGFNRTEQAYELSQQVDFCVVRNKVYPETLIKLLDAKCCNERLFESILDTIRRNKIVVSNILEILADKIIYLAYNPSGLLSGQGFQSKIFEFCECLKELHQDSDYPAYFTLPVLEKIFEALCSVKREEISSYLGHRLKYMLVSFLQNSEISNDLKDKMWRKLYSDTNFHNTTGPTTLEYLFNINEKRTWEKLPYIARINLFFDDTPTFKHLKSWLDTHPTVWRDDLNKFFIENNFIVDTDNVPLIWLEEIAKDIYEDAYDTR